MTFPIPPNEEQRLAALRAYQILDTPPEEAFDRITKLAARLFKCPIVTISLLDQDRQWFKSRIGTDARETPRELAFCTYAILSDEVMVVPDAKQDARFAGNPLVTAAPHMRFYAGAPLRTAAGLNLGTLCVIDTEPRVFSDSDRATLADLAALACDELELRQAAGEVRQSEAKFRALTDNAYDIITLLSPTGEILFESPSLERALGYRPEEIVGRSSFGFVHPDDLALVLERFGQLREQHTSVRVEYRWRHKDGSWRWLESIGANRTDDPVVNGIVVNSRDVTERRATEERLRLLESVAVNARDAVLITEARPIDPPGPRIVYVNEAFTKMTGYSVEEIVGKKPRIFQSPKTDRASLDRVRAALENWKPIVVELINQHKDGTEFWVELSVVPVADATGWFTHWVSVQRDITERKQTQKALQQAKEDAERANDAKSEFLSRMSHELRTPLNAILGFAQLLEMDPTLPADQESVGQILSAGRHLLNLINEVLDVARIESGRFEIYIEPVPIEEAFPEALDLVRPLAAAKNIQLSRDSCELVLLADPQRLKQVLLNLLSNAIKYTPAGGRVHLGCKDLTAENGEPWLRFAVTDNGPGISPEDTAKLFAPFERLEADKGPAEGIGLGLVICRRLVEMMGGEIGVESVVGQGSTFWVKLPAAKNPSLSASAGRGVEESAAAATVLYIEEKLSNLRLV
jgi:PAS domain S-box-containing protein